ncbi:unnamed protein product [Chrysoparadoxa australica]
MALQGPSYLLCALPFSRGDNEAPSKWGLNTALNIVDEAVWTFEPVKRKTLPVRRVWPEGFPVPGTNELFKLMSKAYFTDISQPALPRMGMKVPTPEENLTTWLSCRKKQWKEVRITRKAERRPTPEEDFEAWLKRRKWEWSVARLQRQGGNTPRLEDNFDSWLAHRKSVWRLQRQARRRAPGTLGKRLLEAMP